MAVKPYYATGFMGHSHTVNHTVSKQSEALTVWVRSRIYGTHIRHTEHSVAQATVWVKKWRACKGVRTYDCNKTQVSETARKQACISYGNGTPVAASEPMTAKERRSQDTANNQADDLANATCLVQYESL
ncbi:hypothetical protein ARMGADRAFT_1087887 [Armillaria gallica]|uniref:Uncharacterized protein n=1 Tax=Armillaria gallica TaxID=47427 RepID=A0A2H3CSZ8_ARMGA|nr:hypothetical protein ARMGADRAFT_1087887 [Armillaria gallica]